MITYSDDGPEFEPDDPLAVILRPGPDRLGPPPGREQPHGEHRAYDERVPHVP